jgi:hypothetical protein
MDVIAGTFLPNALVSRANRRLCMRIVRLGSGSVWRMPRPAMSLTTTSAADLSRSAAPCTCVVHAECRAPNANRDGKQDDGNDGPHLRLPNEPTIAPGGLFSSKWPTRGRRALLRAAISVQRSNPPSVDAFKRSRPELARSAGTRSLARASNPQQRPSGLRHPHTGFERAAGAAHRINPESPRRTLRRYRPDGPAVPLRSRR